MGAVRRASDGTLWLFLARADATVMFAMCAMYGKAALGLNRDLIYDHFMIKTGAQRMRAFNSLTTSLLLFCIQVVMMFGMKSPPQLRMPGVLLASLLIYCGRRDMNSMSAATGAHPLQQLSAVILVC